jgi:Ca2+-dependent lipid-binding protein
MIKFSFDDKKFESAAVMSTYNPVWNEVIPSTVRIQNLFSSNMEKCLICDVYDFEKSKKHNYIGSFSVKINGLMRKKLKLSQKYNS